MAPSWVILAQRKVESCIPFFRLCDPAGYPLVYRLEACRLYPLCRLYRVTRLTQHTITPCIAQLVRRRLLAGEAGTDRSVHTCQKYRACTTMAMSISQLSATEHPS